MGPISLVKTAHLHYRKQMSFKKHLTLPLIFCAAHFAFADTVQLKDSAALTGKILAEKPDSVVVDVGYTVLVVPRNEILGITKSSGTLSTTGTPAAPLD